MSLSLTLAVEYGIKLVSPSLGVKSVTCRFSYTFKGIWCVSRFMSRKKCVFFGVVFKRTSFTADIDAGRIDNCSTTGILLCNYYCCCCFFGELYIKNTRWRHITIIYLFSSPLFFGPLRQGPVHCHCLLECLWYTGTPAPRIWIPMNFCHK